jgi:branched-chain amino acid transport system permease protein
MNWQFFLEVLMGGLLAGVMYSLVALGFVLIYKASGVFNFAQGSMVFLAALTFVSLLERGVNFWLAIGITLAVMVVLGIAIERFVLRPLVNQPQITLFMATIGLSFVLEGLSQLVFGSQPHGLEIGIPDVPMQWLSETTGINVSQFDLFAAVVAGILVAVLAVFFQTTRIGRALRAVADDHQAALAVGIPCARSGRRVDGGEFRRAGGGRMWGARNGVQYALTFIALKALPVNLGGFESVAGAIVGGPHHGASEKRPGLEPTSAAGSNPGSHACWSAFPLVRPRACSARSASSGFRRRVLYREADRSGDRRATSGSFRSASHPASQRCFVVAFVVVPPFGSQPAVRHPHAILIFALATLGLNILTVALASCRRHGGVHGGRRVHGVQFRVGAPVCRFGSFTLAGLCGGRRRRLRLAVAAHQGSPRRRHARLPVLRAVASASDGSPITAPPA